MEAKNRKGKVKDCLRSADRLFVGSSTNSVRLDVFFGLDVERGKCGVPGMAPVAIAPTTSTSRAVEEEEEAATAAVCEDIRNLRFK